MAPPSPVLVHPSKGDRSSSYPHKTGPGLAHVAGLSHRADPEPGHSDRHGPPFSLPAEFFAVPSCPSPAPSSACPSLPLPGATVTAWDVGAGLPPSPTQPTPQQLEDPQTPSGTVVRKEPLSGQRPQSSLSLSAHGPGLLPTLGSVFLAQLRTCSLVPQNTLP